MACVDKVRKNGHWRYKVDYYDHLGTRVIHYHRTKGAAELELREALRLKEQRTRPAIDPKTTATVYAAHWFTMKATHLKPRTVASYRSTWALHLEPTVGAIAVARLTRGLLKRLLVEKLGAGYAADSVRVMHATLRTMLRDAVEDGLLLQNPADGLHRALRLVAGARARSERVQALDEEQLARFVHGLTLLPIGPRTLLTLLPDTGLRIGEALALQGDDFNWDRLELRVERAFSQAGTLDTPKSGHGRTLDLSRSPHAVAAVRELLAERRSAKVVSLSPWLFQTATGTPFTHRNVLRDMKRVLKHAKLPTHFNLKSLRHTFASQRVAAGENVYWVSQQLGHASTKLTLDTYGRWLRARPNTSLAPTGSQDRKPSALAGV